MQNLRATLDALRDDDPDFVSVTYGALGSTRDRTIDIVKWIKQDLGIEAMAHFTCVGATKEELRETLSEIEAAGVENVLALRGDPPAGEEEWTPTPGGLLYSTELIELLGEHFGFAVGAAAFPEVHPEAESPESDLAFLKEKQDAGAQFFITQLFFDNEYYFDFIARAREAGITVPIIPGMMPVTSVATSSGSPSCASRRSRRTSSASWRRARTTTPRCRTSAWPTRRCNAWTSWRAGRPGSTSTRSTDPPRRARSSPPCGRRSRGRAPRSRSSRCALSRSRAAARMTLPSRRGSPGPRAPRRWSCRTTPSCCSPGRSTPSGRWSCSTARASGPSG